MEYAERAIIKEQERGWPIRNMLLLRAFEAKLREIERAEVPNSGIAPPQDRFAKRVYAARRAANERHLREFKEQRDDPIEVLAKLGIKAE